MIRIASVILALVGSLSFLSALNLNPSYTFFEAIPTGNCVHLRWETFGDQDIKRFEVLRAHGNEEPKVIAVVQPSHDEYAYEYVDSYGNQPNSSDLLSILLSERNRQNNSKIVNYTLRLHTDNEVLKYDATAITAVNSFNLSLSKLADLFK